MLTEKAIRDAQPKAQHYIVWDGKIAGFGVRVFPKGRKSYVIMYRVNGKQVMATLGRVSDVPLKDARTRAAEELLAVRQGKDDLRTRRQAVKDAPKMTDLWEKFETDFAPDRISAGRLSRRTFLEYRKQFHRHVAPALGSRRVVDVSRADVEKFARRLSHIPMQRNRTLALLSRLFNLAEVWEWRGQHSNPVRGVTRAKENVRDRVLAGSEMQRLNAALIALEDQHPFETRAIYCAAMTGLRISEVLSLQWEHVDLELGRAILPETKSGKRVLVLAGPVRDLLAGLPRINDTVFVFPSMYRRRGDCSVTYKQARDVFAKACERAGLVDCRLHDLRRSVATHLAAAGVSAFLLRDTLGHKTLDMSNRYVRQAGMALIQTAEQAASFALAAMQPEKQDQ